MSPADQEISWRELSRLIGYSVKFIEFNHKFLTRVKGTRSGVVRIFGAKGVDVTFEHPTPVELTSTIFIINKVNYECDAYLYC